MFIIAKQRISSCKNDQNLSDNRRLKAIEFAFGPTGLFQN